MERKKRWRWSVIKRELTGNRAEGACNFGRKNPHPRAAALWPWQWLVHRGVTLRLFTVFITLSITDYKCTLCGLLPYALLHHVALSSLTLRPTRDGRRSASVPGHALTIAVECSGCFIACGSNYTHIWWSFVEMKPIAAPGAGHMSHTVPVCDKVSLNPLPFHYYW